MIDKSILQDQINKIKNIQDQNEQIFAGSIEKVDHEIDQLVELNRILIVAFADDLAQHFTQKMIERHSRRLDDFLNGYLADDLETFFGDMAVDLDSAFDVGFSTSELKQTKTALNKFYKYLHTQDLISTEFYHQQIEILKPQFSAADAQHKLEEERALMKTALMDMNPVFSSDVDELLGHYFSAFANLYGMIPCDQAYRIILRQNPQLKLAAPDFNRFIDQLGDQAVSDYIILPLSESLLVNQELVTGDGHQLAELQNSVELLPYAIPKKTTLLKYADENYVEPTPQLKAVKPFYHDTLGVPDSKLSALTNETVKTVRTWSAESVSQMFGTINEMLLKRGYGCDDQDTLEQLMQLYNATPQWLLRGYTPTQARTHSSVVELVDDS